MEGNTITIALLGNSAAEKNALFYGLTHHPDYPLFFVSLSRFPIPRATYRYRDDEYLLLNLEETTSLPSRSCQNNFTTQLLFSGRADVFLVSCHARYLEDGLKLLSQLLKLPQVKETATPVVLCISFDKKAIAMGLNIDFDLLEDVLQIPVLPFYPSSATSLDDIKTAVSAVWSRLFSYECLDFSPKKLAAEATTWQIPPTPSLKERLNLACFILSLLLFLIWLFFIGPAAPSLGLFKLLHWVQKRIITAGIQRTWGSLLFLFFSG